MAKSTSGIKLFRGDQILIPGIERIFNSSAPQVEGGEKKRNRARKPKPQKPVQLSLLDLAERSLAGG
jgi:hypothetical protein